jgi:hypothetical protein
VSDVVKVLTEQDIVLNERELKELSADTARQLKIDPDAAKKFLAEAGWISKRFGVNDETNYEAL